MDAGATALISKPADEPKSPNPAPSRSNSALPKTWEEMRAILQVIPVSEQKYMNTTIKPSPSTTITRPLIRPKFVDISRGARLQRLGEHVSIDSRVLDSYAEIDPCLGRNLVGTVLTVLSQHIMANPGGGGDEQLPVAVRRRDDDREIELILTLSRTRRGGQLALVLALADERELQ